MSRTLRIAIIIGALGLFATAIIIKQRGREASGGDPAALAPTPHGEAAGKTTGGARQTEALPRLVDLGANYCVPCKLMKPILQELQADYASRFAVEVIDVREDRAAAERYGVRVIPTQIFYDAQGQERFRHEGFMAKEEILAKWRELGVDPGPAAADEGAAGR